MKKCSPLCGKIMGIVRILLGIAMLYYGLTKLGVSPEMQAFVGGAAHKVGLTFLSTTAWFWIATVAEILAGLFLISGCVKLTKIGAWLSLIVLLFALNATGWMAWPAWILLILSLAVIACGRGCRGFCPCASCKACADKDGGCCGGVCGTNFKNDAAAVGAGAVAGAQNALDTAKNVATNAVDNAKGAVEKVKDIAENALDRADELVDNAKDIAEKVSDTVEKVGGEMGKKATEVAKNALDKADQAIDTAKEFVDNADEHTSSKA